MKRTEIIYSMFIYRRFLVGAALCDLFLNSVSMALPIPLRLGDDISYEFLSYVWGSPKATIEQGKICISLLGCQISRSRIWIWAS